MKPLIYGPVASRRLGHSLGVDLVPFKTCSYNCIYCQLGRCEKTTVTRKPYVEPDAILFQLARKLEQGTQADFITLGGSGEPTLNSEIGPLITQIKKLSRIPIAVLTNGSLLALPEVREGLQGADVVIPSLDAHDEKGFERINRPHPAVRFDTMVEGLITFGEVFSGKVWLEVFVLQGINDSRDDARRFKRWIDRIAPDKIHVNTAVRPPAEPYARQVPAEKLLEFCAVLGDKAQMAFGLPGALKQGQVLNLEEAVLDLLARRPCTLEDMATGLNVAQPRVAQCVDILLAGRRIEPMRKEEQVYYKLRR